MAPSTVFGARFVCVYAMVSGRSSFFSANFDSSHKIVAEKRAQRCISASRLWRFIGALAESAAGTQYPTVILHENDRIDAVRSQQMCPQQMGEGQVSIHSPHTDHIYTRMNLEGAKKPPADKQAEACFT